MASRKGAVDAAEIAATGLAVTMVAEDARGPRGLLERTVMDFPTQPSAMTDGPLAPGPPEPPADPG